MTCNILKASALYIESSNQNRATSTASTYKQSFEGILSYIHETSIIVQKNKQEIKTDIKMSPKSQGLFSTVSDLTPITSYKMLCSIWYGKTDCFRDYRLWYLKTDCFRGYHLWYGKTDCFGGYCLSYRNTDCFRGYCL